MAVVTLNPTEDTYVNMFDQAANNGSAATLECDMGDANNSGTDKSKVPLFKFQLPADFGTVNTATLRVYCTNAGGSAATCWTVDPSTWNSATNWTNQPSPVTSMGLMSSASASVYHTRDVTSALSGMNANGYVSFGLYANSTNGMDYNSVEAASNKPELVIDYTASAGPSTPYKVFVMVNG